MNRRVIFSTRHSYAEPNEGK